MNIAIFIAIFLNIDIIIVIDVIDITIDARYYFTFQFKINNLIATK